MYFDGLCEPKNPGGVATYGFVAKSDGRVICKGKGVVGAGFLGDDVTNNVAEYTALIRGLECLKEKGIKKVKIRGDSQLVIRQLKGEYRVRSERMKPLYRKAMELLKDFEYQLEWVPRELNKEADQLSREAFKEFIKKYEKEYREFYGA
ncbi:ribonuclease H [Ignicoccus islandicus DSM 13165]|uniref:Ribonuclease H n=1 Tax=Ignicoccus islandicus DSM 13165 TaxID=940295 RepID=A0A0U3F5R6_9CREN|nr:ribonuclease HI [Ignicoccus islandicus]ALU11416.1 ribonuclease H [Ignicoccus islandicus DSM 13165]